MKCRRQVGSEILHHARRTPARFSRLFAAQRERNDESATMHYRARNYDPRIGRFLAKDPANLHNEHYLYIKNQPLAWRDPTGEDWTVDRKGGTRAIAKNSSPRDTVANLARIVRMDAHEFSDWLKVTDKSAAMLPAKEGDPIGALGEFSVPNTVVIAAGDGWLFGRMFTTVWALRLEDAFKKRGFYTQHYNEESVPVRGGSATVIASVTSRNTWGYAFIGHGYNDGMLAGSFAYKNTWYGAPSQLIVPWSIRNAYKYGGAINYHCNADKGRWGANVAKNGTWHHSTGLTTALAGPRSFGHWGSWDSLVEEMVMPKGLEK